MHKVEEELSTTHIIKYFPIFYQIPEPYIM